MAILAVFAGLFVSCRPGSDEPDSGADARQGADSGQLAPDPSSEHQSEPQTSSALLVTASEGGSIAVMGNGATMVAKGAPGQYIGPWGAFTLLSDGQVLAWDGQKSVPRFDFRGVLSEQGRRSKWHWSVSPGGSAAAVASKEAIHISTTSGDASQIRLASIKTSDGRVPSLMDLGVGSGLAIDDSGDRLLLSLASPTRFEDNSSQRTLPDLFLLDTKTGVARFLRSGSTPGWLDDHRVALLDYEPSDDGLLLCFYVFDLETASVVARVPDVVGYGIAKGRVFVLRDNGKELSVTHYNGDFQPASSVVFERPKGATIGSRAYGLGAVHTVSPVN